MNLRNLLKHRNTIYGFLALWILLFHINRRLGEPIDIPVIGNIIISGNICVDIFMFFSGCCLYLSMDKKPDIKAYIKRRVFRLLPSYLILSIPFWIWRSLIEAPREGGGFHFIRFFADLSSASFWLSGVETLWFVDAILVFYLLFPLVFRIINKGTVSTLILVIVVYLFNIIGIYFVPIYRNSSIAWTRLPVFIFGSIAGKYIDGFDLHNINRVARIIVLGVCALVLLFNFIIYPISSVIKILSIPSEYLWLINGLLAIMVIILLVASLSTCEKNSHNRLIGVVGKMSLEIYMSHIVLLHCLTFYGWIELLRGWTFIIIPFISIMVSLATHHVVANKYYLTRW